MTAKDIQGLLAEMSDPVHAENCQRFFKTGKGEYGEKDMFRGVRVPDLRALARRWKEVPFDEMLQLLQSPYHEDRFTALCLLVHVFQSGRQDEVYNAYLEFMPFVNSWDLVDASCHKILGAYLFERPRTLLYSLAWSDNLWKQRIAIVATYYFVKHGQYMDTLALSDMLSCSPWNLVHKACGWMLCEVGKHDMSLLMDFLDERTVILPKTALRYAVKKFPSLERDKYLKQWKTLFSMPRRISQYRAYWYVMRAKQHLRGDVIQTPVIRSEILGNPRGAAVFLKLENEQHSGSFKYRGALNTILSYRISSPTFTAASTGNHGLAIAMILEKLNQKITIYVPHTADPHKIETLRKHGCKIFFHGEDGVEAEEEAQIIARLLKREYISPYNDWHVIAGQGTVGIELLEQLGQLDYVFASVGGGGLISGMALPLKAHFPDTRIIGCSPERSNIMQKSVEAGHIVKQPILPTLSDGTAGGIEEDAVTLELCMDLVDDWITATEEEIADAMRLMYREHDIKMEGAAAVTVACFRKYGEDIRGKRIALIICGGNISPDKFDAVIAQSG